jgi:hypothetical protein
MSSMDAGRRRSAWPLLLALALLALGGSAAPARAEPSDTLPGFPFYASLETEGEAFAAPPGTGFEGPCGMAVDSNGAFYVSDYYNDSVDAFAANRLFLAQLFKVDPLDGPCGIAVAAGGDLYVNDFHGSVRAYAPTQFPLAHLTGYAAGAMFDPGPSTGVAVDQATGYVYVDDRTYVAVYEPSGAPVEVGGEPLRIGLGSLGDGYGVAVSGYPATAGYVYVPDAASDTVKVYDPAVDSEDPVQTIDGHETLEGGFVSLRDSAVAVDRVRGIVFVADNLQPEYRERPEAAIYAFGPSGAYIGRLKYNVVDALPPGLAVDNSEKSTQGQIYVTSGNTEGASVCAYAHAPQSLTLLVVPASCHPAPVGSGSATQAQAVDAGPAPAQSDTAARPDPPAHASETAQKGNLFVRVAGRLSPSALPRSGEAPIGVFFAGRIATRDGSSPPQLKQLRIELNRHGRLDFRGLPACPVSRIQPASTARALAACRASLVGSGSFRADIVLAGQEPYPTKGRLLVFIGRRHGRPVLLGQIYAAHPFATSFVIPFAIRRIAHGDYGTALTASLPQALGSWGYVTAIQMKLGRRFSYRGKRHSFISAGCPAPKGFPGAIFKLARTSFGFAGGTRLNSTLTRSCNARG